jgi:hypothetical protein
LAGTLLCASALVPAQQPPPTQLTASGQIDVAGRSAHYIIRHLPVSSFPELPAGIQSQLNQRGCLIPQTYEAHHPENVVRASLDRQGSSDWAVLCSAQGTVSLLVFFEGNSAEPMMLASAQETERLQAHNPSGVLGFNWGIDPATPEQIHEAQSSMKRRPMRLDHDALADSIVDRQTIYHYYAKSVWAQVAMQD